MNSYLLPLKSNNSIVLWRLAILFLVVPGIIAFWLIFMWSNDPQLDNFPSPRLPPGYDDGVHELLQNERWYPDRIPVDSFESSNHPTKYGILAMSAYEGWIVTLFTNPPTAQVYDVTDEPKLLSAFVLPSTPSSIVGAGSHHFAFIANDDLNKLVVVNALSGKHSICDLNSPGCVDTEIVLSSDDSRFALCSSSSTSTLVSGLLRPGPVVAEVTTKYVEELNKSRECCVASHQDGRIYFAAKHGIFELSAAETKPTMRFPLQANESVRTIALSRDGLGVMAFAHTDGGRNRIKLLHIGDTIDVRDIAVVNEQIHHIFFIRQKNMIVTVGDRFNVPAFPLAVVSQRLCAWSLINKPELIGSWDIELHAVAGAYCAQDGNSVTLVTPNGDVSIVSLKLHDDR